jgi:hypothetical protein
VLESLVNNDLALALATFDIRSVICQEYREKLLRTGDRAGNSDDETDALTGTRQTRRRYSIKLLYSVIMIHIPYEVGLAQ